MEEKLLEVQKEMQNKRIDKLLSDEFDISRSRIQSMIKNDQILVNGKSTKANYKVNENDQIKLFDTTCEELKVEKENIDLDIVYEDEDVIVINKERGMVVHPAPGNLKHTLVNALMYHCDDLSGINGVLRPGIVHRIDKDTSGLLIVAKNDQAHLSLSNQLQAKEVSRKYLALVHGVIEHDYGTIDAPIGRDIKDRKKMAVTATNSKDATTHFKVIKRYKDATLVSCELETGRTHQIRVHMAYIGHPIMGDETYAYRKTLKVNGQLLHAYELTFRHPSTGKKITVQADLPEVFKNVLKEYDEQD